MKILVDTSVWSLALRRRDSLGLSSEEQKLKAQLAQAVQDGRVVMIGLIRQELLSGIKEQAQFQKVQAALSPFLDETITTEDHEFAAQLYNECRSQGVEAGTVDMLICAVASRRGWEVLSSDSGLNRCFALARKYWAEARTTDEANAPRSKRKPNAKASNKK